MKTLTVIIVFAIFIIGISGYLIKVKTLPVEDLDVVAPASSKTRVYHQKLVLPLFENVCGDSTDPNIRRLALEFTLDVADYSKPEVVKNLRDLDSKGLLSKGEIFSEYNPDHMNELKIIYDVLYHAKNFDAFYKTAAWARQNVNCRLYVDAIYLAMLNRKDTEGLSIPAPYELLPNYFIGADVVIQASSILAGNEVTLSENIREEGNAFVMDANYTANFYDNDDESKLAYFCEDIGLNSYYHLRKLKLARQLNEGINGTYGENMYQMMRQFMARYNLERYANGMPELDSVDWNALPETPYDPMLIYTDGNEFAHRSSQMVLNSEDVALLQTIESNIVTVVSHMRQSGYNKTQILNHLMEILVTSDRSYETLARQLLGKDLSNNRYTSVLDHYMTSLRDPMFWKINKKIVDMVESALNVLPPYSKNELVFPGVQVMNIEVKKAMTVYDYFEFDVTDALKIDDSNSTFRVKIGQPRLNHKPFTIKLNISSLVASKGLVKIYLGPKVAPGELMAKKNLFVLYDIFDVNLKRGINVISRTSEEIKYYAPDFVSLPTLRKNVLDAEYGLDSLPSWTIEKQVGYPSRLTLPKGTATGLPLQMFVFVAPFYKANVGELYSTNSMEFNSAILSPGYPLDLTIPDKLLFGLPNAMMRYIYVTHKGDGKVENYGGPGVSNKWYSVSTYDPSSRPSYSGNGGNSFDYSSKREQYGGQKDMIVETTEINMQDQDLSSSEENVEQIYFPDTPRLLLFSGYDYSSKAQEKEPFDYKAKKAQFGKKDYTDKRGDYTKYRIISTTESIAPVNVAEVTEIVSVNDERENQDINNMADSDLLEPRIIDVHENENNDVKDVYHTISMITTKRPLTLFDILLKSFDYDDKVYE